MILASAQNADRKEETMSSTQASLVNMAANAPVAVKANGKNQTIDMAAVMAELARLKAENDALKHQVSAMPKAKEMFFKVTDKGQISWYWLCGQRFPVTHGVEQWETIIANVEPLKAFIAANNSKLVRR